MSTLVYLGLGSNQDREFNLQCALSFLCSLLVDVQCSPVYASAPVGARGQAFYNLVISGRTDLSVEQLCRMIKRFESRYRRHFQPSLIMPIDIDVLLYGRYVGEFKGVVLPRLDLIQSPYVMLPIAALAPHETHPGTGRTFNEIWLDFEHRVAPHKQPVLVAIPEDINVVITKSRADVKVLRFRRDHGLRWLATFAV